MYMDTHIGTINSLKLFPQLKMLDNCGEAPDTITNCTKDMGDKNRLQKWTRAFGYVPVLEDIYNVSATISVSLFKHNLHVYT